MKYNNCLYYCRSSSIARMSRFSTQQVCELDIMFNLEKAHFILDEMVQNGCVVDTNKYNALNPLYLMEKHSSGG